MIAKFGFAIM